MLQRSSMPADESLAPDATRLFVQLLDEQQSLTAVERFVATGSAPLRSATGAPPAATNRYRSLLPATPPAPGQQYAFEVDLDRCSGCKSCVTACHTLNGLDDEETWRDVGLLIGGSRTAPVLQHVTAACHHCLEPACMIACPVNAYEKDPVTGIVRHLDDQCFGCQYCTMACPYDVPKYQPGKSIVRKCDMCSARLAVGEPPACVQGCPHEAIAVRLVDQAQVREDAEAALFLPAAPDPQLTLPTTAYKTAKAFPRNLLSADYFRVNPQHAHWPLIVMLVLTQLSVGAFLAGQIIERLIDHASVSRMHSLHAVQALAFGLLALSASLLHLGRPQYAYRAIVGFRHSWLSREIFAFVIFAGLATLYAATVGWTSPLVDMHRWLGWSVAAAGILAVFCSTMIYVCTHRECWNFARVAIRFMSTTSLLGVAAVWLTILISYLSSPATALEAARNLGPALCWTLVTFSGVKLAWEAAAFRHLFANRMTSMRRSALLMSGDLSNVTLARFALGVLGGIVLPASLAAQLGAASNDAEVIQFVVTTALIFVACLGGELLERYLFFAACAAPQMPGGIR
jgi:formate dehydrogenase iron-sulfur subunit